MNNQTFIQSATTLVSLIAVISGVLISITTY